MCGVGVEVAMVRPIAWSRGERRADRCSRPQQFKVKTLSSVSSGGRSSMVVVRELGEARTGAMADGRGQYNKDVEVGVSS